MLLLNLVDASVLQVRPESTIQHSKHAPWGVLQGGEQKEKDEAGKKLTACSVFSPNRQTAPRHQTHTAHLRLASMLLRPRTFSLHRALQAALAVREDMVIPVNCPRRATDLPYRPLLRLRLLYRRHLSRLRLQQQPQDLTRCLRKPGQHWLPCRMNKRCARSLLSTPFLLCIFSRKDHVSKSRYGASATSAMADL